MKNNTTTSNFKARFYFTVIVILVSFCFRALAQERNLLTGNYSLRDISEIIIPHNEFKPYPKIKEREEWMKYPDEIRDYYIHKGEEFIDFDWPNLPATVFMDFHRTGNRSNYEALYIHRREVLSQLIMAEMMEGKGRFIDNIINGIWAICEETHWGLPAHLYMQKGNRVLANVEEPTVDFAVGRTASILAWTVYFMESELDSITPLICDRIRYEVDKRVLIPCYTRNDFWWQGLTPLHELNIGLERLNNWAPWNDFYWLTCVILLEEDEDVRHKAIHKIMLCLDQYLNPYPADGGCDEGPGYWNVAGGNLFYCLDLLNTASLGKIDIFDEPLIHNIGEYIYKVHINGYYFINFADASPIVHPNTALIYNYGKKIKSPEMMAFATNFASVSEKKLYENNRITYDLARQLPDFFGMDELRSATQEELYVKDTWFPDIQVMAAKSKQKSKKDLYIAAKAGHNYESHNHNDVGNFIVYKNGRPLLIDVGVGTYSKQTFDPKHRYEIWTMQSAYHNLPTINGVMQKEGLAMRATNVTYDANRNQASLGMDIAKAYPEEAKVSSYHREVKLQRGKYVALTEKYSLNEFIEPIQLNLMTPFIVETTMQGEVKIIPNDEKQEESTIYFDASKLGVKAEVMEIQDKRLQKHWGDKLTRITFTVKDKNLSGEFSLKIY